MRHYAILAAAAACLLNAGALVYAGPLYYSANGSLHRATLAGGDVQDLNSVYSNFGIALDATGNRMFWTDELPTVPVGPSGIIGAAALDGTEAHAPLSRIAAPIGIALDLARGKMYWTASDNAVRRANLDGTDAQIVLQQDNVAQLSGIVVDALRQRLYFSYVNPLIDSARPGFIGSMNLDGTDLQAAVSGLVNPQGLGFDLHAARLYWADADAIQTADLAGQEPKNLVSGLNQPFGVALDLPGSQIFWTEPAIGKIQRASLSGGEPVDVLDKLFNPTAIAILMAPQPGDANGDGLVDFYDLGILLNHYDQFGSFADGDFDQSGVVDFADLGMLLNNYGPPAATIGAAAEVPESGAYALGLVSLFGLLCFRVRFGKRRGAGRPPVFA
jgi:hypothetical protein